MTKTLTEQWKNRTLYGGWYFLEFENGLILPVYYCGFNREFEFGWDWKISKVLAPASYDHFVELTEKANQFSQMVKKVNKLEKQLDIATKTLKKISVSLWDEMECRDCAQKALKEIDEVLK